MWEHDLPPEKIDTGGWDMIGLLFGTEAFAFRDQHLDPGVTRRADSLSWPSIGRGGRC